MNHLTELRRMLCSSAWAIQPEYLSSMLADIERLGQGGATAEHATEALKAATEIEAARRQQIAASTGGAVVVLPLYGVITQRSNWMSYYFGGTTTESFAMQFRQALADPNVTAIVIDVDSPGGSVAGVDELASEIYSARGKKTIVAISNTLNASAAYYISSQASELWVSPSSLTGSIGVYNTHIDQSKALETYGIKVTLISAGKFKTEGNSYEPFTEEAQAAAQVLVSGYYTAFVKAVARGRGVKMADVTSGFAEGRVVMAAQAVDFNMADKVGTLDGILAKFGVKRTGQEGSYAEGQSSAPSANVEAAKADDENDDAVPGDEPCDCDCTSCANGDCSGCTVDACDAEGCTCDSADSKKSKAKAESDLQIALHRQRVALALAL